MKDRKEISALKRLVVLNQSAGYLMVDIINANSESYEEIILITGNFNPRQTPLKANARIEKIIRYDRSSTLKRLVTWGVAFLQMYSKVLRYKSNSHFIIVSNPPFSFLLPLQNASYSLLVYDIYPNALVDYKYVKNSSLIVTWWKRRNRSIYSKAKNIYTISEGMRSILAEYSPIEKIQVVPVWTDNQFLKPITKKENVFLKKNNLSDRFIVQYSGNIGRTHNVSIMLELAQRIDNPSVHFLIIGEGTEKANLERQSEEARLTNITFLPWQETSLLPFSLSAADVGMVSLGKDASNLSVPSKTFNLMSVGVPILCLASKESELARLVDKYEFGKCFDATEVESMITFINDLQRSSEKREMYSKNALAASFNFGPDNATRIR